MLGVGWTEMLVIGVVALIVIGPKDLPMVMQRVGKFAGMIRRMGSEFQRELNKTTGLNEVRNLRDSIAAPLKQTADEIRREFNATSASGAVKPTGVIAPRRPGVESIVDEIHEAAGMTPPAAEPIKGKRLTPVPTSKVETQELAALAQPPAESVAEKPVRKPRTRKAAAPVAAAEPAAKPAARKAAAPKATAAAPAKPKAAAKPKAPAKPKTAEAKPAETTAKSAASKPKAAAKPKATKPKAQEKPTS
ncbi:hypothetical protein JP74_20025 [Devosia sp. 17-2-E-8]|nr:hypothetical protein JP74_20025 [Devosia sp. 17-2-E-8]